MQAVWFNDFPKQFSVPFVVSEPCPSLRASDCQLRFCARIFGETGPGHQNFVKLSR